MSSFLFIMTAGSLFATSFGLSWYIPVTLALLCIASNIDDFRKQSKQSTTQHVYAQKRVTYDSADPIGHNFDTKR